MAKKFGKAMRSDSHLMTVHPGLVVENGQAAPGNKIQVNLSDVEMSKQAIKQDDSDT